MPVRRPAALRILILTLPLAGLALAAAPPARATLQFQQVFIDVYLADHPDRDYVEFVRCQAKCFTCHQGSEDRRNHNAFGKELAKFLDALADRENTAKIISVLHEAENAPVDAAEPDGPTFGQRIDDSKLPAGELEDSQQEPDNSTSTPPTR